MPSSDCVLLLHSHLPWVLHHGQWPHGSDWLCEAAAASYLPLIERLRSLQEQGIPAPVTLGVTPVLGAQLAHPHFVREFDTYLDARVAACRDGKRQLAGTADANLLPVVDFWAHRFAQLRRLWRSIDRNIPAALTALADQGRLELITSAATHAFLPLLGRDESIALQLGVGHATHRGLFGRESRGCWLPECAWRNAGEWEPLPGALNAGQRTGLAPFLERAGFEYVCADAHMANAGAATGVYGTLFHGRSAASDPAPRPVAVHRSPRAVYRISDRLVAFIRDPESSNPVWDRHRGYPGHHEYLEFHKLWWPGGLRLWRVTDRTGDLGDKLQYDPVAAATAARQHGAEFAGRMARTAESGSQVLAAPFDTELFGHWWFEGPAFLEAAFEQLSSCPQVRPVLAAEHAARVRETAETITLQEGSWGRDGDYGMWLNHQVAWTWPIVWELENRFWDLAPRALSVDSLGPLVEQAARELLLLQSSDWAFIITTGDAADYGAARFLGHAHACREFTGLLERALRGDDVTRGIDRAEERRQHTDLFPDLRPHLADALQPT